MRHKRCHREELSLLVRPESGLEVQLSSLVLWLSESALRCGAHTYLLLPSERAELWACARAQPTPISLACCRNDFQLDFLKGFGPCLPGA